MYGSEKSMLLLLGGGFGTALGLFVCDPEQG